MAKQESKSSGRKSKDARGNPTKETRARARNTGRSGRTAPVLDRVIHESLRLQILAALAVNDSLTFPELKKLLKITDGNLSVHARKLEEAAYIACEKSFEGRTPRTEFRMTVSGKRALNKYLDQMEALIHTMRR